MSNRRRFRPAVVALADQVEAATDQAWARLSHRVQHDGWTQYPESANATSPVRREMLRRLSLMMMTKGLTGVSTTCDHVSFTAPTVAHFLGWAPDRIRCDTCAIHEFERVRGTAEDSVCDYCRESSNPIHATVALLRAIIVDADPPFALPALMIHYGLCRECTKLDAV